MPYPVLDGALRTLIAQLASLHADDIVAILTVLSPEDRQAVEEYLRDHMGRFETAIALSESHTAFDAARMSAWLAQHLQAPDAGAMMTPHARQALQLCAARLYPGAGAPA
jgi:hypothetical protein